MPCNAPARWRRHEVKLLVVACNTASAVALPAAQAALAPWPVIGVVEAGAEAAVAAAPHGPHRRDRHRRHRRGRRVPARHPRACAGRACGAAGMPVVRGAGRGRHHLEARSPSSQCGAISIRCSRAHGKPECLLLGCTHYPVLAEAIARVAGPEVALVDSAETTAAATARLIAETRPCALRASAPAAPVFLATDAPERFARVGEIFLGATIDPARRTSSSSSEVQRIIDAHQSQAFGRRHRPAARRGRAPQARAPCRARAICLRRRVSASPPSSAPGCAGTSAPRA